MSEELQRLADHDNVSVLSDSSINEMTTPESHMDEKHDIRLLATQEKFKKRLNQGNNINITNLRKGKWTIEEENYTNKIISLFNKGKLPIPGGTTLRSYLSEKLNCDPMRITKKFAGATSIGKVVYQPADNQSDSHKRLEEDLADIEELNRLEALFLEKLHGKSQTLSREPSGIGLNNLSLSYNEEKTPPIKIQSSTTANGLGAGSGTQLPIYESNISKAFNYVGQQQRMTAANGYPSNFMTADSNESAIQRSMKRISSAPNFSHLSTLRNSSPWIHQSYEEPVIKPIQRSFPTHLQTIPIIPIPTSKSPNPESMLPSTNILSSQYNTTGSSNPPSSTYTNLMKAKKRSQSVMDFSEYEQLLHTADLLLQLSSSVKPMVTIQSQISSQLEASPDSDISHDGGEYVVGLSLEEESNWQHHHTDHLHVSKRGRVDFISAENSF